MQEWGRDGTTGLQKRQKGLSFPALKRNGSKFVAAAPG